MLQTSIVPDSMNSNRIYIEDEIHACLKDAGASIRAISSYMRCLMSKDATQIGAVHLTSRQSRFLARAQDALLWQRLMVGRTATPRLLQALLALEIEAEMQHDAAALFLRDHGWSRQWIRGGRLMAAAGDLGLRTRLVVDEHGLRVVEHSPFRTYALVQPNYRPLPELLDRLRASGYVSEWPDWPHRDKDGGASLGEDPVFYLRCMLELKMSREEIEYLTGVKSKIIAYQFGNALRHLGIDDLNAYRGSHLLLNWDWFRTRRYKVREAIKRMRKPYIPRAERSGQPQLMTPEFVVRTRLEKEMELLRLPRWSKRGPRGTSRHLGPLAQEFESVLRVAGLKQSYILLLQRRIGFDEHAPATYRECAQLLNVTVTRARQIVSKSGRTIQSYMRTRWHRLLLPCFSAAILDIEERAEESPLTFEEVGMILLEKRYSYFAVRGDSFLEAVRLLCLSTSLRLVPQDISPRRLLHIGYNKEQAAPLLTEELVNARYHHKESAAVSQ